MAYFKLWNQAEAEDAAQEAFVRSLAAIGSLRDGKKYFGFLKTITQNCCNAIITQSLPHVREIQVTLTMKKENEAAFLTQLKKSGTMQMEQEGFRNDDGNMVVILKAIK